MSTSGRLRIVADAHIWGVEAAFSSLPGYDVSLRTFEHSGITRKILQDADILITRSSTRVNDELLEGTPVQFAATATIGDDHYDKAYLNSRRISFANAAGSSTGSVIEYMLAALLELNARGLTDISATCLGIIGAGRIGGGFERICQKLGMHLLVNDPPRARKEGPAGFVDLDKMLACTDVISLHTPLTHDGSNPSFHLIDADALSRFRGHGVINAGRGPCLDNQALLEWLEGDISRWAVLDCWENEPAISPHLLAHPQIIIATPHIAGHSLDGKAANTQFAYNALCQHLGIQPVWNMRDDLPEVTQNVLRVTANGDTLATLHSAVSKLYGICRDDRDLRSSGTIENESLAHVFTRLRRYYPVRRAWSHYSIRFDPPHAETARLAAAIGLHVV